MPFRTTSRSGPRPRSRRWVTPRGCAFVAFATGDSIPEYRVRWATVEQGIVAVNQDGLAIAVGEGTARVVALAMVNASLGASTQVTVAATVDRVALSHTADTLAVGATNIYSAVARDRRGNPVQRVFSWTSSNSAIASVTSSQIPTTSSTAQVIARQAGTVTLTVSAGGKSSFVEVTVRSIPVATVVVTPPSAALTPGGTVQLSADPRDAAGNSLSGRSVGWSSSNPAAATVTQTGLVTAVSQGSALIRATVEGVSADVPVTVGPVPVATVQVTPANPTLTATPRDAAGTPLTGRTVTWSSSAPAVATVNASTGIVTGVAVGTATITATSEGRTGSTVVTVTQAPVATITLGAPTNRIDQFAHLELFANLRDQNGNALSNRTVTWTSSDTLIAKTTPSTSQLGRVMGRNPGSATITATSEGRSANFLLTVDQSFTGPRVYLAQDRTIGIVEAFSIMNYKGERGFFETSIGPTFFGKLVGMATDGFRVYATDVTANRVIRFDPFGSFVSNVPVGAGPEAIAITPDNSRAYVANTGAGTVSVIDLSSFSVIATIGVGSSPSGVAVRPDGARVFVTNRQSGTLSIISTSTNTVVNTINVGPDPLSIAISPDGTKAYITRPSCACVTPFNLANNGVGANILVGDPPAGLAFAAGRAYVATSGGVVMIDAASNAVLGEINTGGDLAGVTTDGSVVYVADRNRRLIRIDTSNNSFFTRLTQGTDPRGIVLRP